MNSLLDDNDDDIQDHHHGRAGRGQDREITLGITVILGIFFALAVFGALMFGFGYSIGAKHTQSAIAGAQADPNATFNGFKPPSGKTASDLAKATPAPASVTVPLTSLPPQPLPRAASRPAAETTAEAESIPAAVALPVRATAPPVAAPTARPAIATPATPPPAGALMVQIAAISAAHQEDADSVATSLKRKGYAVSIRHEPADQLLHVQVGPFATRKDADAMRQRIQADGFNAIVKDPSH